MLEQDYVMGLVKEMVRTILKLVFDIDTDSPTLDLLENDDEKDNLKTLFSMVDAGKIDEAEEQIFDLVEKKDRSDLETVLLFFSYLNEKSNDFLEEHNFSRTELHEDLKYVVAQYGLDGMAELFAR